jgi:integrase/recombinase XerD
MVSSDWQACQIQIWRDHMRIARLQGETRQDLFDDHIKLFLLDLHSAGYAELTLRKKRPILRSFARWANQREIGVLDFNDRHVVAFVADSARKSKAFVMLQLSVVRHFLRYLRSGASEQRPPILEDTSAADDLLRRYEDFLRRDRGLAENSIHVYIPFIRSFLTSHAARRGRVPQRLFNTLAIQNFILGLIHNRSSEYVRLLATALRSFFRFLFLSGLIPQDLSPSVPRVCKYRHATPPAFLVPEETERVLAMTDRSTPTGRRDYAILILLARLGLRAGEIVVLELDDLRWRTGEIVVHGKGRIVDQLPLLRDIGDALTTYLREDRGASASRKVFLRMWAPRTGLTGPAAIGHIVRRAFVRAGIRRTGRGAAHLFRHGLATNMIRHGASMSEISEVLRHRSQTTTAAYAQVSFEALRTVALPWPVAGGER